MTVSFVDATAAARRIAEMPPSDPEYVLRDFARDVETLKDFVLAGDTERLRENADALARALSFMIKWARAGGDAPLATIGFDALLAEYRAALAEGGT